MRIVTNSNIVEKNDRMKKLVVDQSKTGTEIYIASAFFSEYDILKQMNDNDCHVLMIIRLNFGTNPTAIRKALLLENVSIRFYTSNSFHPKFYIFGNRIAYVGSSNFTLSGLMMNQEVNVEIDGEESAFDELNEAFFDYWDSAQPLETKHVNEFEAIVKHLSKPDPSHEIYTRIGKYEYNNVGLQEPKGTGRNSFIDGFKRQYQLYLKKFGILSELFDDIGLRKFPALPLRIEVDSFLSWVRGVHAKGESYRGVETRTREQISEILSKLVKDFYESTNNFLNTETVPRYLAVSNNFSSPEIIKKLSLKDLVETLRNVYAFHDRLRYFPGGWKTLIDEFVKRNSEKQIKSSIIYLLFGQDDYHERIYECIHGKYQLFEFGANSVTEMFGLVNKNDIPILNGRTRKSMEWLGFGKL